MSRRLVPSLGLAVALALIIPAPLQGQSPGSDAPEADVSDNFAFEQDRTERMTVPVSIGGRGPYRFVVDTGAERTVISRELARELSLDAGPPPGSTA
ncbi:MAG: aspartyl protease family protein [Sphingomonas sp.]|nr:aspartyl protease family protein [Sphingomonas sp.]